MFNSQIYLKSLMTLPLDEIFRFGVVGIAATIVHVATLTAGVELGGISPVVMNGFAFCMAVCTTYFGQTLWVFKARSSNIKQISRFSASVIFGVLSNMAIMAVAVHIFGASYMVGFVVGLTFVPMATYLINKFWVFRS